MNHLKQYFQTSLTEQCIGEYMTKSMDAPVSFPNIIKFYNNGMDGEDVID